MQKRLISIAVLIIFTILIFLFFSPSKSILKKRVPYSAAKYEAAVKQGDYYYTKMHLFGWRKAQTFYNNAFLMKQSPQLRDKLFLTLCLTAVREKAERILNPSTYEKIDELDLKEIARNPKLALLVTLVKDLRTKPINRSKGGRSRGKILYMKYIDDSLFDIQHSPQDFYLYLCLLNTYCFNPRKLDDRLMDLYAEKGFNALFKKYLLHPLFIYFNPSFVTGREKEIEGKRPQFAEYYLARGNHYFSANRFTMAHRYFDKALGLLPDYGDAINGIGNIYYFTVKNYEKSESIYSRTLKNDPLNPVALFGKGVSLHNMKQWDASHKVLDIMLSRQSLYHGEAYYYKGFNYFLENRFAEARQMVEQSRKLLPGSGEVLLLSAKLHMKDKNMMEAETDLLKSLDDNHYPKAYPFYFLGMLHLKAGDWLFYDYFNQSRNHFQKSLQKKQREIAGIDGLDLDEDIKKWMKFDRKKKYSEFQEKSSTILTRIADLLIRNESMQSQSAVPVKTASRGRKITTNGNNLLHTAAAEGNVKMAERLIKEGVAIDVMNKLGYTPLYYSAMMGKVEMVEYLIGKGATVNMRIPSGYTPLHEAAFSRHEAVAAMLLKHGAGVYAADELGIRPILHGKSKLPGLIDQLSPLHAAVEKGDVEALRQLVSQPEMRQAIDVRSLQKRTPLFLAVVKGNTDMVRVLLEAGADPNIPDYKVFTALGFAQKEGFKEIESLLVARGAKNSYADRLALALQEKEAFIWYVSGNTWSIKTAESVLIFNYIPPVSRAFQFKRDDFIVGEQLYHFPTAEIPTACFFSHRASWGLNRDISAIYQWGNIKKDISYVMPWPEPRQPKQPNHIQTWPGHDAKCGKILIRTVSLAKHRDDKKGENNVGYWVKSDGLVIFYAGRGLLNPGENPQEWLNIQPIKEWGPVDIVILPVHGKKEHPQTQMALALLKQLKPRMMFPLYSGSAKHYYHEFAAEINKLSVDTVVRYAEKNGQQFKYN